MLQPALALILGVGITGFFALLGEDSRPGLDSELYAVAACEARNALLGETIAALRPWRTAEHRTVTLAPLQTHPAFGGLPEARLGLRV